jgi:peptidyl-prolyl cis-trans isomerase A (cyclophilin A)
MIRPLAFALLSLFAGACGDEQPVDKPVAAKDSVAASEPGSAPAPAPKADIVRVILTTEAGPIVVALDAKHAPITTANFLRYVDARRYDGTSIYRSAQTPRAAGHGFIQGGIRRNYKLMFPPILHEPTSKTGLRHEAGTISMARSDTGAGAMGEFFITASALPKMDAHKDEPGYAAFGKVVVGMDVVRTILGAPTITEAGRGAMRGQMLAKPVRILSARREP